MLKEVYFFRQPNLSLRKKAGRPNPNKWHMTIIYPMEDVNFWNAVHEEDFEVLQHYDYTSMYEDFITDLANDWCPPENQQESALCSIGIDSSLEDNGQDLSREKPIGTNSY